MKRSILCTPWMMEGETAYVGNDKKSEIVKQLKIFGTRDIMLGKL